MDKYPDRQVQKPICDWWVIYKFDYLDGFLEGKNWEKNKKSNVDEKLD